MFVKLKDINTIKKEFKVVDGLVTLAEGRDVYIDESQYDEVNVIEVNERDKYGFHWWQVNQYFGQLVPEEFIECVLTKVA